MKTWSDPLNSEDERMLFSFVYDVNMGWIGKRFSTEEEAEKASKIYAECRRKNTIPENAINIVDTVWNYNKHLKPLPVKLSIN